MLNGFFYYHQLQRDRNGLNVLFISVDTLRADHLGSYGYIRDTSPNIDNLAKEGILFSHAVVQWPKTAPSFASMLTSTYGHYNGVIRTTPLKIDTYFVLLPEILKNADYNTVAVVTNGTLAAAYNFNQGIDTHIETWKEYGSKDAEYVTEYALSWLRDNSNKGKFFMWLHYLDPHARYEPPEPYNEMYVGDDFYDGSQKTKLNPGIGEAIGGIPGRSHLGNHTEVDYYIAQYDAEIRYMDEHIGKVLDAVKAIGLSDNTIIVFTADHGESLGEHNYYFEHGKLPYDDCVRVPLIIKVPGLQSEIKVIDQPVELINLMPTILDILNVPVNDEAQGRSLAPLMLGNGDSIPKYAFTEAGFQMDYQRMIRTKKWKLIYIPDKNDQGIMQGIPFELYDIENDRKELNNLINVETRVADELKKELFKWMESAKKVNRLPSPENVSIDKETEENLKSLGYIE
jgi:arylsulfatase A-like enzyme